MNRLKNKCIYIQSPFLIFPGRQANLFTGIEILESGQVKAAEKTRG
jgi:hypothetical protein